MSGASQLASGKGHRDENFPVASVLLKRAHRAPIMAYYRFARAADDIADHPTADPAEKLRLLGQMRAGLDGEGSPEAMALAAAIRPLGLDTTHGHDLLTAFERDVTQHRYADWTDLMDYCRYSAMPVGRFVLDVHRESRDSWPANDALCAALQIINHLQDCGKDYRAINRVYLPLDMIAASGAHVDMLGMDRAPASLLGAIRAAAARTRTLLDASAGFAGMIRDRRLAAEVAIIHRLAVSLCDRLMTRDPLSQRVHHGKGEAAMLATGAALGSLFRRAA